MKPNHHVENALLRDRSGPVNAMNPLVALFYDLLKEGTPAPQDLEVMVRNACATAAAVETVEYSNGYLAKYAADLAQRLIAANEDILEQTIERAYWGFDRNRNLAGGTMTDRDAFKSEVRKLLKGNY